MNVTRQFLAYYKPYIRTLFYDLFCAILIGVTGVLFPVVIRDLTNRVFILNDPQAMTALLMRDAVFLLLLYVIEALAQYYMTVYGHLMGAKMEADMRSDLFSHLERLSFSYFDKTNTGIWFPA